jgi:Xaa-Pro aminopeptidase
VPDDAAVPSPGGHRAAARRFPPISEVRTMDVKTIQQALREQGLDGWLLCDFRNRDFLSYKVLGLDFAKKLSRRWYYWIPARGTPKKLVSRVEPHALDTLPGTTIGYTGWPELHQRMGGMLAAKKRIAMQYSPKNNTPYISIADAGTVELIRGLGHKVVSSADLLQMFASRIPPEGYRLHREAGERVDRIRAEAFDEIQTAARTGKGTEWDIVQFIMRRFEEEGLTTYAAPMVGVNDHPADPHFEVTRENARRLEMGDCVLMDLWAKRNVPGGIYYDITWVAFLGDDPPAKYLKIWNAARAGRDAAIEFVTKRLEHGIPTAGWQVDDACRDVIRRTGFGKQFLHRTGHAIDTETHGDGGNIDNFETRDERRLLPGCCFSIEPGIYLAGEMAVRTEINMFVREDGTAEVTGEIQREMLKLV